MRTAVARIDVDPAGALSPDGLASGMAVLRQLAEAAGVEVIDTRVEAMPPQRRQVHLLIAGADSGTVEQVGIELCTRAFGTQPSAGVTTYVSRGTDDDAHGVLAGFGIAGEVSWSVGPDGLDVVDVTVRDDDLQRIPESRIRTALEAALNYEVRIRAD